MRVVKITLLSLAALVLLGLAALAVALFQAHQKYQPLTDTFHHAGGNSISLTDGRISYQWHGPEEGEVVVLVHGFSTPKFVWQNTVPDLVSAGYRVLTYDHFGRGHSDRPEQTYNRDFYVRELKELLDGLGLQQPLKLVGYSMGGANITSFAASYPERAKQLVLLAPAGFLQPYTGLFKQLAKPVIGEQLLTLAGPDRFVDALQTAVDNGLISADTPQQFATQFRVQGTPYALNSTLHNYPFYDLKDDYHQVGQSQIPFTVIWGDQDKICPIDGAIAMQQQVQQMQLKTLTGARHDFTFTQASRVNPLILEALQRL
ncbi:MAG: bromoperoxidase [Candidatus Pelagadaptatus aseana]|uniref:alpha/beta fold hydrolase n=1 Tax=Candidatus Pelagadaptatus aseana TaxID=3120508 RepID=UPI0039B29309